jgi:hypothetical protein
MTRTVVQAAFQTPARRSMTIHLAMPPPSPHECAQHPREVSRRSPEERSGVSEPSSHVGCCSHRKLSPPVEVHVGSTWECRNEEL